MKVPEGHQSPNQRIEELRLKLYELVDKEGFTIKSEKMRQLNRELDRLINKMMRDTAARTPGRRAV